MQYCRFCGSKIPTDVIFCPYCGRAIVDDGEAPTVIPASVGPGNQFSDRLPALTHPPQPWGIDAWMGQQTAHAPIDSSRTEGKSMQNTQHTQPPIAPQIGDQTVQARPYTYHPARAPLPPGQQIPSWRFVTGIQVSAARLAANKKARWIIPLIAAVVLLAISGIFLLAENQPPSIAVMGSSAVTVGKTLQVHGTGFLPNGSVVLKLEDGQVLSPYHGIGQNRPRYTYSSRVGQWIDVGRWITGAKHFSEYIDLGQCRRNL